MEKYFSIGEVSKITGLSVDKLRNYDKIGLLKPSFIDPKSGYRYYLEDKFRTLRIIKYLRKIDTPLKDIDLILNKNINSKEFLNFLSLKIKDIDKEIENLNLIKEDINEIKQAFECSFKLSSIDYIHKKYIEKRYVVKKNINKNINFIVSHKEHVFSKFRSEINKLNPPRSIEKGLYLSSLENLNNTNTDVYMLFKDYEKIHNFLIPSGNYLCLSYKENERDEAILKLKSYIKENSIKTKGVVLNLVLTTLPKEEFQFQILI